MPNSTYQELQKTQFDSIELEFKNGKKPIFVCERVSNYTEDNRRCLVTVAFAPPEISQVIEEKLVNPLKEIDPYQYYLPASSLHLSLIILAYNSNPPSFTETDVEMIKQVLNETLPKCPKINYELSGLLVGPNSLSVRCYTGPELNQTVKELRRKLLPLGFDIFDGLASSEIFFGNITFCRFTAEPSQKFLAKVTELKNEYIGKITPDKFNLVSSNAIFHPTKTSFYASIPIGQN